MFGTNTITSGLTLTKVLNGVSRTLSIANQAIPLYQQIKPMVSNARKVMSVLQEFNKPTTSSNKASNNKKVIEANAKEKEAIPKTITSSSPVFFQ